MTGRHTLHDYRYPMCRENVINGDAVPLPIRYTLNSMANTQPSFETVSTFMVNLS